MKTILITGSSGFIGSYFQNTYKEAYNIKTFSFLHSGLEILNCKGIDTILHLSALVHKMNGSSRKEYERINVNQTLQIAKKAKNSGVKHFIFMSTVKVYGEESSITYTETSPCNPQDDYGKSKLHAEQELQKLADGNFIISIIRTPIVYGAGVKANVRSLIDLIQRVPILPFKNTKNRRSMVYVGNLCALIQAILEQQRGGIFLAADDESLSTTEFIQHISDVLNKKSYLIYIPFFERLLKKIKPSFYQRLFQSLLINNTQTKQLLSFRNPYSVKEGIHTMMQGTNL